MKDTIKKMKLNVDLSGFKIVAKTVFTNGKRLLDGMIDAYNNVTQLNPADAIDIYIAAGDKMRQNGDYEGAIRSYKKVLEVDSTHLETLMKLGKAYVSVGLPNEAIEMLSRAAVLNRSDAQCFYHLGSSYYMIDEYAKAVTSFNESIKLDPSFAEAYYKLGLVHDSLSEFDKSIEAYQHAISLNPNFIKAYQSIGLAYEGRGQREEALKYFKKALELEGKGFK
ncbi:tetratricopeptide repeat protein [Candidatus Magnetomonas plexicatena]|uniref:tetratricopeptide repeat protein n=1 Tax=Candidatus Magnetomonas plexicatena TaxID=2552947 RepID=UPI001C77BB20|nr:tetratricopeptide repeat protein [Nitrospirales bacterium LBB_01]